MTPADSTHPFTENVMLFTRALSSAGIPVSISQSMAFCEALTLIDIGSRDQVFHAGRSLLVGRQEHLKLYETLFNLYWQPKRQLGGRGQKMPIAPRHRRPRNHGNDLAMLMSRRAQASDEELEIADKTRSYSAAEVLHNKQFGAMDDEELERVKKLIQAMKWRISERQTRRRVLDKRGDQLALRQSLRSAAKHNGVPMRLSFQTRKIKQRPIVLLADISGSMEKYARLTLQFFYSVSHSLKEVEIFAFGTRLTRLTGSLKIKNIDQAIKQASKEIIDWSGGTRIGESLADFNRQYGRRVLRRGAIVIMMSDGWERGDTGQLSKEMRYLQHRCHRLIWLNPLSGDPRYQPLVEGMAASLPYIDDFLPIHNLQSLEQLAQHLENLSPS